MLDDRFGPLGMVRSRNPVLRLRPDDQRIQSRLRRYPDGPWIRHPDEIYDSDRPTDRFPVDIGKNDYRDLLKKRMEELVKNKDDFKELLCVFTKAKSVDMCALQGADDEDIAIAIERFFVNAHIYLQPGMTAPLGMVERFGHDWRWNARGVYYRHFYSPEWVTGDHSLWVPTLDDLDWNDPTEESRRARARAFLKHARDNEGWNKSEYAWEADAWTDVFGQMRDDPVLASDKHEYYTERAAAHRVSCLQTGQSKFVNRVPDATFGLATFQPKHYQTALASYDLDSERLESVMLHRHCGLISDPRWGDANLVFPFAVYEAKGWSGDPREGRQQACAAGAAYLDTLDALARHPGKLGENDGAYQTPESRSTQVFALTSFGAHWHIMVGYRRPRLAREHAGHTGMSDTVYVFQRIWSARVVTERKAWELLSMVDQIHLWGVTEFRDFVIRHLKPWHEFCKKCYVHDVDAIHDMIAANLGRTGMVPVLPLPQWARHLSDDRRAKLQQRANELLFDAVDKYRPDTRRKEDSYPQMMACLNTGCGPFPGYPISSHEEALKHHIEVHGGTPGDGFREVVEEMFKDEEDSSTTTFCSGTPKPVGLKRQLSSLSDAENGQAVTKKVRL